MHNFLQALSLQEIEWSHEINCNSYCVGYSAEGPVGAGSVFCPSPPPWEAPV